MARKEYAGNAPQCTLTSSMTAGSPTSGQTFTVDDGTGYPTGSTGNFTVKVDAGDPAEEKILCSSRSGNTFTIATGGRGFDSTVAVSHGGGITAGTVDHCIDAESFTEFSAHMYDTTRDDHTQYQKVSTVAELIRDTMGTALVAGSNITITVSDVGDTITIASSASAATAVGARAYRSSTQTITTATATVVLFNAEEYDTNTIHDTSSNTGRFTVPTGKGGKWLFAGNVSWEPNATGQRQCYWKLNGTTVQKGESGLVNLSASTILQNAPTVVLSLSQGDYVEMIVYQDSGGDLTLSATDTVASATYLGA